MCISNVTHFPGMSHRRALPNKCIVCDALSSVWIAWNEQITAIFGPELNNESEVRSAIWCYLILVEKLFQKSMSWQYVWKVVWTNFVSKLETWWAFIIEIVYFKTTIFFARKLKHLSTKNTNRDGFSWCLSRENNLVWFYSNLKFGFFKLKL